jgi:hypothetical protein
MMRSWGRFTGFKSSRSPGVPRLQGAETIESPPGVSRRLWYGRKKAWRALINRDWLWSGQRARARQGRAASAGGSAGPRGRAFAEGHQHHAGAKASMQAKGRAKVHDAVRRRTGKEAVKSGGMTRASQVKVKPSRAAH